MPNGVIPTSKEMDQDCGDRVEKLKMAIRLLLDQVDYTAEPPACRVNEMVGAVLPKEIIEKVRSIAAL